MKSIALTTAAIACLFALASADMAQASSKQQQCEAYARDATRHTGTTTGVVRGAARGAVAGAVLGGNAAGGARAGAVVGGSRRVAQKARSYSYYYNRCMGN
jgi:hypothetical protein